MSFHLATQNQMRLNIRRGADGNEVGMEGTRKAQLNFFPAVKVAHQNIKLDINMYCIYPSIYPSEAVNASS